MTKAELAAVAKWLKDAAAGTFRDPNADRVLAKLRLTREPDAASKRLLVALYHELVLLRGASLPTGTDAESDYPDMPAAEHDEWQIRHFCEMLARAHQRDARAFGGVLSVAWNARLVGLSEGRRPTTTVAVRTVRKRIRTANEKKRQRALWQEKVNERAESGRFTKWKGRGGIAHDVGAEFGVSETLIRDHCTNPLSNKRRP